MITRFNPQRWCVAIALAFAMVAGCAGLPRIDPTGERVFIWPKDQPPTSTLVGPSTTLVAPPVVTDPFFPQQPVVAGPAVPGAVVVPAVTPASVAFAQAPQDKVSITPERVLAPVGSEVVLKASICTTEGYTLADQKVEWMLGRNGVGQFVEVSGKGLFHPPLFPWNKPKKVDNYLATGWTANAPLCVDRGTADPADDVNVNRGDAWISVTSPNEGTSYVTAYTPAVESWEQRKSAATIYWVDVQWTFPPPSVAGGGRSATLTTTVLRQTNGTPIEGWLVRYELADGGGNLAGATSGQVVEMRTDSQGRATVEATPTAAGAASTPVTIQLIRPAGFGGDDSPRLVVGTGNSVIQWTSGSTDYLPPANTTPPPTIDPAPSTQPPVWSPPGTNPGGGASVPSTPVQRPQLDLRLEGDPQAVSGGQTQLTMVIRNIGTAPANDVRVVDRIDPGLMYPPDPNARDVLFTGIGALAPGAELRKTQVFNVMQAGRLCHNVTASCTENANATKRFCITASQPVEARAGSVSVRKEVAPQVIVGQTALFRVTVENTGNIPLVNIRVVDQYPTQFFQVRPPADGASVVSGVITRTIARLEPGQRQVFPVEATCLQPALSVLPRPLVRVTAETDPPTASVPTADEVDMEILPRQGAGGAAPAPATGGIGAPGVGGAAGAPMKVGVAFDVRQGRVGSRAALQVTVVNSSQVDDGNVELILVLPPQMAPDMAGIQAPPNVQVTQTGDQLRFTPIAALRATEPVRYTIPLSIKGPPGFAEVSTFVRSRNLTQNLTSQTPLEILGQ